MVPDSHRFVSKRRQECNYLQAMEGGIDSSHVSFLHRHTMSVDPLFKGAKGNEYNLKDLRPHFEVVESPGGLYIGARRNAGEGEYYWRITQLIIPSFTLIPPRGDHPIGGHSWVPIDDENCWAWSTNHHAARPLKDEERSALEAGMGIHVPLIPGSFRPVANKDNDYLMDRGAQKDGRSFSGVEGFAMQDASVQESMGPIQDRTRENLVPTDQGIIVARRCGPGIEVLVEPEVGRHEHRALAPVVALRLLALWPHQAEPLAAQDDDVGARAVGMRFLIGADGELRNVAVHRALRHAKARM